MLDEKAVDTGDIILNCAEGPAGGPPLVLLHGFTGWWRSWQLLIPQLLPTWHLYACDLRGHGKSGRAANRYRVIDYVQDSVTLLRQYVSQPAILLGRSFGGLVTLGAAADVPEHVRALVLLDPSLFTWRAGLDTLPIVQQRMRWVHETVQAAQSYADVVARCQALMPEADEIRIQMLATQMYGVAPDAVGMVLHHWDEMLEAFDLVAVLQQVTQPTLILRGEPRLGSVIRDEDVEFVHKNLPSAVIINIPNAGHDLDGEQPEAVLHHIQTFLQSV
ncbi:MAG TPA: alpha/beta hydrolase [Herpetosiphonaceae bacterium]|nr:alpha/beta hydrolase [Herpetosiphonaceae bacterium]